MYPEAASTSLADILEGLSPTFGYSNTWIVFPEAICPVVGLRTAVAMMLSGISPAPTGAAGDSDFTGSTAGGGFGCSVVGAGRVLKSFHGPMLPSGGTGRSAI